MKGEGSRFSALTKKRMWIYAVSRLPPYPDWRQAAGMNTIPIAHAAAMIAVRELLLAAKDQPEDSPWQLDCIGAATDIALTLEAYAHLFGPVIADPEQH